MSDRFMEADVDHPCRETCSGWRQGRERGTYEAKQQLMAATNTILSLEQEIKALRSGVIGGGYNSPRETMALMAEGEGNDPSVYRNMARGAMFKLDAAIQDADEIAKKRGKE